MSENTRPEQEEDLGHLEMGEPEMPLEKFFGGCREVVVVVRDGGHHLLDGCMHGRQCLVVIGVSDREI